jgi:NAD-dependent SIR2 family protein deacetylase
MYLRNVTTKSTRNYLEDIKILKDKIENADAIVVGAGAGLSTAAGFIYNGETFKKYMFDFIKEFGITDFYSGGFYPFPTKEIMWAYWSRNIYVNRYFDAPKDTNKKSFEFTKGQRLFCNHDKC